MKNMQQKFNILGIILTIIVVGGLFVQYGYLNAIIMKEKQINIMNTREHLADDINGKISQYSDTVNIIADLMAIGEWTQEDTLEYMMSFQKSSKLIQMMYFGDINNNLINTDHIIPPSSYKVKDRPWYRAAVEQNKLVISDAYAAVREEQVMVSISKPVYQKNGDLIGVISSDIDLEEIFNVVKATTIKGVG